MKSAVLRMLCRFLAVSLVLLPFQSVQAGMIGTDMIGTDRVVSSGAPSERAAVTDAIDRADVARQLQSLGIDPMAAKDRVAALSDDEARSLAGHLKSLPAGGDTTAIGRLLVVAGLVWWFWFR